MPKIKDGATISSGMPAPCCSSLGEAIFESFSLEK